MTYQQATTRPAIARKIGRRELVIFIAAMMATNALAIDMMLPALGIIGDELNVSNDNDRQLVVFAFVFGFGIAQIFFGPLVDRFGRRRVLLGAMTGYAIGCMMSIVADSFSLLLAARLFQGIATAGARVATTAIVRDLCQGRDMAKVMSLAITVFMIAPIIAPLLGQIVLMFATWRFIFGALLLYGLCVAVWAYIRIPETLPSSEAKSILPHQVFSAYYEFLTTRQSIGNTLVSALAFAGLFGYLGASEQVFLEVFEIGDMFALAFGAVSTALAMATFVNSKLVTRYGMRKLMHAAVILYAIASILHLVFTLMIGPSLVLFLTFTSINFFAIGLIGPNCTALAMEPMGHIAGSASAANGFVGTTMGAVVGGLVARSFNGTPTPVIIGYTILGLMALVAVLWTEKGQLFQAQNDAEQNA